MNVPNALTVLRLILVVPFAYLLFAHGTETWAQVWAAVIFVVASATDFADGALARKYDLVTSFGKIADPIADKALTGVAFLGLSYLGLLPWWITIVMIAREVWVTLVRFRVIRYGVIPASRGGKLKTVLQILAILLFLVPLSGAWVDLRWLVMGAAVVVALVTAVDYTVQAVSLRRRVIAERASGRASAVESTSESA